MFLAATLTILSALLIERHRVSRFEAGLFAYVNTLPGTANALLGSIGQLGNFLVVPMASIAAFAARRRRLALDLASAGSLAWLLGKVIKRFIQRGRPGEYLTEVVVRGSPQEGLGFVSGHVAVVAALATVAAPFLPRRVRWLPWAIVALVGVSRIYVGAHLPLDVVGGASLGWLTGLAVKVFGRGRAGAPRDVLWIVGLGVLLQVFLFTLVADSASTLRLLASPRWGWIAAAALASVPAYRAVRTRDEERSDIIPDSYGPLPRVAGAVAHTVAIALVLALAAATAGVTLRLPSNWILLVVIAATVTLLGVSLGMSRKRRRRSWRAWTGPRKGLVTVLDRRALAAPTARSLVFIALGSAAFAASVYSFQSGVSVVAPVVVYVVTMAVAAASPLPGHLGAAEVVLVGGLIAAAVPATPAVVAVLLFRLLTLWAPLLLKALLAPAGGRRASPAQRRRQPSPEARTV